MRNLCDQRLVDDQAKALTFYTDKLGFTVKNEFPSETTAG